MVAVNYYSHYNHERTTTDATTDHSVVSADAADQWLEALTEAEVDELADLLASLDSMLDLHPRQKAS